MNNLPINSPLQSISHPLCTKHGIKLSIKRDDLIHPTLSGNKWRKLKFTLAHAQDNEYQQLVSFGGAYSNHIHALAFAGKLHGFKTHGIIRGEYDPQNPTIVDAKSAGMTLDFISRAQYRLRYSEQYLAEIQSRFSKALIIPEGGTNQFALAGVAEIIDEIQSDNVDYICTPCGSGGTTAGLLSHHNDINVVSVPVLKNAEYLQNEIATLVGMPLSKLKLQFIQGYHFGGYGKTTPQLLEFITQFFNHSRIMLEPIYSGKMVYAIFDLIAQGHFPQGSHVVLLHTGGLQGLNGLIQRKKLPEQWLGWQRHEKPANS